MPVEIMHFRDAEEILKSKRLNVEFAMNHLHEYLFDSPCKTEVCEFALKELGWRDTYRRILDGRPYFYSGLKDKVAIDNDFENPKYLLEGLVRLQVGFEQHMIEAGILMLTGKNGHMPAAVSIESARADIQMLYPTICLPLTIAVFNFEPIQLPVKVLRKESDNGIPVLSTSNNVPDEFDEPWP